MTRLESFDKYTRGFGSRQNRGVFAFGPILQTASHHQSHHKADYAFTTRFSILFKILLICGVSQPFDLLTHIYLNNVRSSLYFFRVFFMNFWSLEHFKGHLTLFRWLDCKSILDAANVKSRRANVIKHGLNVLHSFLNFSPFVLFLETTISRKGIC